MTVNYEEYWKIKRSFLARHNNDFRVDTSSMDGYGCYHKEYVCSDGAIFYETMSPEFATKEIEFEVKMINVKTEVTVKLLRTEFWSSDDSVSRSYYEKF